ncbi:unnamed protein product [Miscanthus lutarioriparius]|uniref:Acireductone dioxygenase n=1 Tax=Miscanthus lutarioriparius TaxID=422564 RepID=A0A811SS91_9POAL|nr:unnamed protein product [Miscanthus lutarioriparius]
MNCEGAIYKSACSRSVQAEHKKRRPLVPDSTLRSIREDEEIRRQKEKPSSDTAYGLRTWRASSRNIAENFVYAAYLLSCCHKRKAPTAILKLDFRKAFDSVSWDRLDRIMQARGFGNTWCTWISRTLHTGKTAILLNGTPGRWFQCRRGLRQGDPIYPYLFIIVSDVLQRLIQRASANGELCHPIDPDDTLILLKGDVASVAKLRQILDAFSLATGLHINFHKSTFIPMNIDSAAATEMVNILGCDVSSFPQTYFGRPLSPHKLKDGKEEVIQAWYMDDSEEDQRLPHHREPKEFIPLDKLSELGILSWRLNAGDWENDENLKKIREARGYSYMDICDVCPEKLPNYEAKIKNFFEEHLHTDEEIRYCLEGSGYFDVRDQNDQWIRVAVKKGGMIVLPAGMYHRFTLDTDNYIKAMRLFVGEPVWTPYNRPHDHLPARKEYVEKIINRGGNQTVEAR